jgi:hypothetical protein
VPFKTDLQKVRLFLGGSYSLKLSPPHFLYFLKLLPAESTKQILSDS